MLPERWREEGWEAVSGTTQVTDFACSLEGTEDQL